MLYLHLGAHKTATTFLQNVLMSNEKELSQRGVQRLKIRARHLFWHLYRDGDRDAYVQRRRAFGRKIKQFEAAGGHGIFSSETMFGTSDLAEVECLYPKADQALKTLATLTDGMDRKVVFYIRRQDDFIESTFINRIQTLATSLHLDHKSLLKDDSWHDFPSYLKTFDPACLSWLELIERMAHYFGPENLIIRPFESIRRGKAAYASAFLAPVCPELEGLSLAPNVYANHSFSAPALKAFLTQARQQEYKHLKTLRLQLQETYPNTKYPRPKLLTEIQKQQIMDLHKAENAKLFERFIAPEDQIYAYS